MSSRRVIVPAVPGSDPNPQRATSLDGAPERIEAELASEDRLASWGDTVEQDDNEIEVVADTASDSNDARLREDVPPHNV